MMTLEEIQEKLSRLNNWDLEGESIVREFTFSDFKEALKFVNKVGDIAEKNEHHPEIYISYNTVKVILTTHKERGLTYLDFRVAEEIDKSAS